MMLSLQRFVLAAMTLCLSLLCMFLIKLYQQRRRMKDLPGPPYHPIFGHLLVAGKMTKALPPDVHPHHYWLWLRETYNLGDFYYFDVWPLGPTTLVICEADIADQVTVKHSLDKHPMVKQYLKQHLGSENMASANGVAWRKARTIYNPGFATSHLMTMISDIVEDVEIFHDVLSEFSVTREIFEMEAVAMKLSFDMIGRLVLDMSLYSQRTTNELVDAFRRQLHTLSSSTTWSNPFGAFDPIRRYSIWRNSRVIDTCLSRELDRRFGSATSKINGSKKQRRSMLGLALDTYNAEIRGVNPIAGRTMDKTFKQSAIDQIRTFVFAGHDTVSTTIAMTFYYLHLNQSARARACAELDSIFGPDRHETAKMIRENPYILNRMVYNHAVVKEVLRLFPPANTVRIGEPDFLISSSDGNSYPTKDCVVWVDPYVMGRDPKHFPEPQKFIPERFLADSPYPEVPPGAWRPFERGPRNCIGSEFGTLELKVVMALTLRDFEFEPEYQAGALEVDGEKCYQMLFGSAKPKSGVPGRVVKFAKKEKS